MPNIPQTELPKPKSWDEFEDIVADLYVRHWNDPNVKRYGRTGQAQQGVDIYGRPANLRGGYAGVQCKRYDEGTLTLQIIEREIASAEEFRPPLAEYTIATTDRRDAKLQEAVRLITQEREAAGKFPVRTAFWEDLCSLLSHPDNHDLLLKHYGDWVRCARPPVPRRHLCIRELKLRTRRLTRKSARDHALWFNLHFIVENQGPMEAEDVRLGTISLNRYPPGNSMSPTPSLLSYIEVQYPDAQKYPGDCVISHTVTTSENMDPFADYPLSLPAEYTALLAVYDRWYTPYDWNAAVYLMSKGTLPAWYQLSLTVPRSLEHWESGTTLLSSESDLLRIAQVTGERPVVAWEGEEL